MEEALLEAMCAAARAGDAATLREQSLQKGVLPAGVVAHAVLGGSRECFEIATGGLPMRWKALGTTMDLFEADGVVDDLSDAQLAAAAELMPARVRNDEEESSTLAAACFRAPTRVLRALLAAGHPGTGHAVYNLAHRRDPFLREELSLVIAAMPAAELGESNNGFGFVSRALLHLLGEREWESVAELVRAGVDLEATALGRPVGEHVVLRAASGGGGAADLLTAVLDECGYPLTQELLRTAASWASFPELLRRFGQRPADDHMLACRALQTVESTRALLERGWLPLPLPEDMLICASADVVRLLADELRPHQALLAAAMARAASSEAALAMAELSEAPPGPRALKGMCINDRPEAFHALVRQFPQLLAPAPAELASGETLLDLASLGGSHAWQMAADSAQCTPTLHWLARRARGNFSRERLRAALDARSELPPAPAEVAAATHHPELLDALFEEFPAAHFEGALAGMRPFRERMLTALLQRGVRVPVGVVASVWEAFTSQRRSAAHVAEGFAVGQALKPQHVRSFVFMPPGLAAHSMRAPQHLQDLVARLRLRGLFMLFASLARRLPTASAGAGYALARVGHLPGRARRLLGEILTGDAMVGGEAEEDASGVSGDVFSDDFW